MSRSRVIYGDGVYRALAYGGGCVEVLLNEMHGFGSVEINVMEGEIWASAHVRAIHCTCVDMCSRVTIHMGGRARVHLVHARTRTHGHVNTHKHTCTRTRAHLYAKTDTS